MHFKLLQGLCVVSVIVSHPFLVAANPAAFSVERRSTTGDPPYESPNRKMVAARSASALQSRGDGLSDFLKFEHVLPFIDDTVPSAQNQADLSGSHSPFAAHVQLKSSLPTLLLEEHEGVLESIVCSGPIIQLGFYDSAVSSVAWRQTQQYPAFLVITSHSGCNADGERHPYLVQNVQKEKRFLVLSVVSTSFKQSFHSIDVRFGSKHEAVPLQRHDQLKKRQVASATPAPSSEPPVTSFPPAPSSTPTATVIAGASITTAWKGTTILPPSFPGADLFVPDLPLGLTVQCKDCSLQGSIDLSDGIIGATQPEASEDEDFLDVVAGNIDEIVDFYQNGYVELKVNDFFAHIELESTVKPSAELTTWVAPFPDIGIPGWVIPKIAEVGPILRPLITFGVELATELKFTYGFDLTIPNNSTIHIDINHPIDNSSVTGFQNTNFTALPFQSEVDSLNLTVSAAFNPQILLTINVFDDSASIAAGAFLDLPKLSAKIAQVSDVDDDCNPTNASTSNDDKDDTMLTNIIPSVNFGVGVLVEAELDVEVYETHGGASTTFASTGYPLPTACMSFDGKRKTYGAANAETTGAGEKNAAANGKGGNGAVVALAMIVAWAVWGM